MVKDAWLFSYEVASRDYAARGILPGDRVAPVAVFFPRSNQRRVLESRPSCTCPDRGAPAGDLLEGKELEVFGLKCGELEGVLGLLHPALGPNSAHWAAC